MDTTARFCHLTVDEVKKPAYVWHEAKWQFVNEFHAHKMGQLIFVEKGMQYLYTDSRAYLLPTYHCAWIPPGLVHKTASPLAAVFLRCIFFLNPPEHSFFNEIKIFNAPKVLIEMILFTERWSRMEAYDEIESKFLTALIEILPQVFQSASPLVLPIPQNPRIAGIVNYLNEYLLEGLNLAMIAKRFNVSVRTLERLFKDDIGLTPSGYIKLLKMIKAVEFLTAEGAGVKQVATKVGYDSVSTFSNTFFETLGLRPQEMISKG